MSGLRKQQELQRKLAAQLTTPPNTFNALMNSGSVSTSVSVATSPIDIMTNSIIQPHQNQSPTNPDAMRVIRAGSASPGVGMEVEIEVNDGGGVETNFRELQNSQGTHLELFILAKRRPFARN